MIKNFAHKGLQKFLESGDTSGIPAVQSKKIKVILELLDEIVEPNGAAFPGSNFHPLKGNRKGEYAVSVNGNYRITFRFDKRTKYVLDVNYEDYH